MRFSHHPKLSVWFTREAENGTDATGEVPRLAFVENATPSEAMNRPTRNTPYRLIVLVITAPCLSVVLRLGFFAETHPSRPS